MSKKKSAKKRSHLQEVIWERDAASKTAMELVLMVESLIEKLLETRRCMVDDEVSRARLLLARIRKGGKFQ
jgi:hypothetical protein